MARGAPAGWLEDERGAMWPPEKVAPIDRARHELVMELAQSWIDFNRALRDLKIRAIGDVHAFVEMSAEEYGAKVGGSKGNVQLVSFDGRFKVQLHVHQFIAFDERLQAAKALIDECINEWADGANENLRVLINDAFDTDKQGNVSTSKILSLRRIRIDDQRWKHAMQALADCMMVCGSKNYIRVYRRNGEDNRWQAIPLDIAVL